MSERVEREKKTEHCLMPCMRYVFRHPVLANLLLLAVIIVGGLLGKQLSVQSMPDFPWPVISVRVEWPSANVAEVHERITVPMANELQAASALKSMESFSRRGESFVMLTFKTQADISQAFDEVRNLLAKIDLPKTALLPEITEEQWQDPLLKLVIYGDDIDNLRYWVNESKRTLLSEYNMDQVMISGLTNQSLHIDVRMLDMHRLQMPIDTLANQLADVSEQVPIGRFETEKLNMVVRSQSKPRYDHDIEQKVIALGGQAYQVSDIAQTRYSDESVDPYLYFKQKPAALLEVNRSTQNGGDSIALVDRFYKWYKTAQAKWPESIKSQLFMSEYRLMEERVQMLLENGLLGMIGIGLILMIFIEWHVALWIAAGVPTAMMAALAIVGYWGMSINFLSSFGFLIALGLIVDDAIVVAEHAYAHFQRGMSPERAIENSVNRMFPPILASSMTTVGAFMPILLMQSRYAIFLQDIPKVVVAVIMASLLECFFILPYHVRRSLQQVKVSKGPKRLLGWSERLQNQWHGFQFYTLKQILHRCARHAWITLSCIVFCVCMPVVLLITQHVPYNFIPYVARDYIALEVTFLPGTSKVEMQQYMQEAEKALMRADRGLNKGQDLLVKAALHKYLLPAIPMEKSPVFSGGIMNHASILVVLKDPAKRSVSNQQIKKQWMLELDPSVKVEQFSIKEPQSETPWQDINLMLQADDWQKLSEATAFTKMRLSKYKDIANITDNSPWGSVEYEIAIKPQARLLGVTKQMVSSQVQDILRGSTVTVNNLSGNENLTMRLQLSPKDIMGEHSLESLPIHVAGKQLTLSEVADWSIHQQPQIYYQYNGKLAIKVGADVKEFSGSAAQIRRVIQEKEIPEIKRRFHVDIQDHLEAPDEKEAIEEIRYGVIVGIVVIYFVLAWISRSYYWPLGIMMVIPIGFSGAIMGHYWMKTDFSLLSMVAIFGLSGVVINTSIILFHQYRVLTYEYPKISACERMIKSVCYRFRAIFLTAITTTAGLLPILMETSQQAKWVQPFAISFIFGLLFSMIFVCIGMPACVALVEKGDAGNA